MTSQRSLFNQRVVGKLPVLALLGPMMVGVVLVPLREYVDATSVALMLAVTVAIVAVFGRRLLAVVAGLLAGGVQDFFWTQPYYRLATTDHRVIQTAMLLIAIGALVSEAVWYRQRGGRQAARSQRYLANAMTIALPLTGADVGREIRVVERRVTRMLELDSCRYRPEPADVLVGGTVVDVASFAVLTATGAVVINGRAIDADQHGLPTDRPIIVAVQAGGRDYGHLELVAASRWSRPTAEQRRVTVLMARQLGELLSRRR